MNEIKITIVGDQGVGKSIVARGIAHVLHVHGFSPTITDDERSPFTPFTKTPNALEQITPCSVLISTKQVV